MSKPKRYKPKSMYPMPVEAIFQNPAFLALPVAGRGMLFTILLHYWKSELRPLPIHDDALAAVARAHRPTWRHHRAEIMGIFDAVRPELDAYFNLREAKGTTLAFASARGLARKRAERALNSAHAPSALPSIPVTDHRLPRPTPATPPKTARPVHTDRRT